MIILWINAAPPPHQYIREREKESGRRGYIQREKERERTHINLYPCFYSFKISIKF